MAGRPVARPRKGDAEKSQRTGRRKCLRHRRRSVESDTKRRANGRGFMTNCTPETPVPPVTNRPSRRAPRCRN